MHTPKIISIASATLLLSLSSAAQALSILPGQFVSGIELGYIVKQGNLTGNQFQWQGSSVLGENNEYVTNHGTIYGAFAGYQIPCRNFILGLEAYFDFGRYEQVTYFPAPLLGANVNSSVLFYRDCSYGVTGRLGYKVASCFIPYLRAGAQGGEDHFLINYAGLPSLPTWDRFETKRVNWDWLVAAGVEVPFFSKKVSLRLEYDYLFAHTLDFSDIAAPVEAEYYYSPHAHIVKLQWVWNFC